MTSERQRYDLEDQLSRLVALRDSGAPLTPEARAAIVDLGRRVEELRAAEGALGPRLPEPTEPEPAPNYAELPDADMAARLATRSWQRGLSAHLEGLGKDEPARLLSILRNAATQYRPSDEVPPSGSRRYRIVPQFPMEATRCLRAVSSTATTDRQDAFLDCWDSLFPIAAGLAVGDLGTDRIDYVMAALNHPGGPLMEALFGFFWKGSIGWDSGLDTRFTQRLAEALESDAPGAVTCRTMIASRLLPLHVADATWTEAHVLSRMIWTTSADAPWLWQGYLSNAHISSRLILAMKASLIETFGHLDALGPWGESLSGLLVTIALNPDNKELLSPAEAGDCLRRVGSSGRASVVGHLAKRLEAAEGKSASLWTRRIGPWLVRCWPRDSAVRADPDTSDRLGWMLTKCGEAFPKAVEILLPLLGKAGDTSLTLHELTGQQLPKKYPKESLLLADALAPDDLEEWQHSAFHELLASIRAADSALEDHAAYRRLRDLAS